MICLGIDVGSTSIKGCVLDLQQQAVREVRQVPFPTPLDAPRDRPPGHFEVDTDLVADKVQILVEDLVAETPAAEAIFCAGQMGGLTIQMIGCATTLTPYLSWRDQRAVVGARNFVEAIRERLGADRLAELGNELQAGSTLTLLYWLAQHGELPRGGMPATIADFAIARRCGEEPQMHPTQAIGLLNLTEGDWHHEVFEALGIETHWPRLASEREPIGRAQFGKRWLPCYAALGDQQAALRGAGLQRNELSLNISTGSQVSRRTAAFEPGQYQTRSYFGGDFLNTITHLPAGRSLNVLFDFVTEFARAQQVPLDNAWQYIALQAAHADDSLDADLAFFAGPLGNSGSLRGITTENFTIGHVFRAALRNMAENYHRCAERLCPTEKALRLCVSGGLTRNMPLLRQMIEERFRLPLRESVGEEETLLGLLDLAREVYPN